MPPKKARSSSPATERRERLTLAKLASYDDVATDALVDHAYFWTTTRKNRNKYGPARGIHDDDVGHILLHDVVVAKDVQTAERKLLELPGLRKYLANLPSPREKDWFRRHLRKYVQMYHPDCPFEVTTTNRYIITQHEAAICARKFIKAGQEIKYLSGTLVAMTKEEEMDLGLTRKDFSVVMSSRRKTPSFFLGPARFANHDCDANGRLVTRGTEGMSVMATRDIHEGEEITVSYGEDYFGIDNCECLCMTCEHEVRNGWSPQVESEENDKGSSPVSVDEAGLVDGELASKKRRRDSDHDMDETSSICSTPNKRAKFHRQTSKLREEICMSELPAEGTATPETEMPLTPDSDLDAPVISASVASERQVSKLRQEIMVTQSPPETLIPSTEKTEQSQQTDNEFAVIETDAVTLVDPTTITNHPANGPVDCHSPSSTDESHQSSTSSLPTSVDDTGIKVKSEELAESRHPDPSQVTEGPLDIPITGQPETTISPPRSPTPSELSDLSDSFELDDTLQTVVEKKRKPRRKRNWAIVSSVETEVPITRSPGDYTKTSRLLAQKYDRWVDCQTCESWFVQSNSYQTRRECPRCERHSKIYGFQWPKTDKGADRQERVMDHRTIHRFLSPDSEARVSRRDRGISFGVTPTPELSDARTETPASDANESRRTTRASRRRTRDFRMTM
ncbi:Histone-lysine N-methyltransferase set9 [Penicillium cataractarum]|uniref:Histone-lysine N-methyltransferase SET9 n=1 Tax=Penicillium cataractarum TaxID=2100454 RepID=A0A9W9S3N2_9EURO|nr:Histone-lysine N-methyltransferase set9 [Penicillium cataractarum]KAJ5368998.1 Histone-lysine N-methyltransferase set9 [Penicillium cataractarum]